MKKKKCGNRCCVPTCEFPDDGTLTYHQFPKAGTKVVIKNAQGQAFYCDRRKIWEDRVGADFAIHKTSKVCSIHFAEEDYCLKSRQQIGNRRLLQTAVPTLYLPDEENSAFTKFKQKPKLLGEVVVNDNSTPIRRRLRLRTKRSKSQNDPQEDQIPSERIVSPGLEINRQDTNEKSQKLTPNLESRATPATIPQELSSEPPKNALQMAESAIFETIVIFKTEDVEITENDVKEEIKTEEIKSDNTEHEKEAFLDMVLMQTSYEMEKFTSGTYSTLSYL